MNVHYRDVLVTHLDDSWINYCIVGLAKILKLVISKLVGLKILKKMDLDSPNEQNVKVAIL
jgi:hypothetical protein